VLLPFPPTPEVLRQHPAAQRLVIDHNPIFISQVLGGYGRAESLFLRTGIFFLEFS
jgi:hypothetical protein